MNPLILVVEDNDSMREGLQILLDAEGFQAVSATNGADALGLMEKRVPDLVLSDIAMPEMDGYQLLKKVRAKPDWESIPFIFLTARGEKEDIIQGKKLGVEDYLVKPVSRSELVITIRSRLERSRQLMLVQLQHAYESSLMILANAIEMRDKYTRGHAERVTSYCLSIARQLGWTEKQLSALKFSAILHDIGKIFIREDILIKAGPLDAMEWAEMVRHPQMGARLLGRIPYLAEALPAIQYHHERWDGSGYPEGLKGEAIPLSARIIAVADALDAMTSERVYQPAMPIQQALQEINQQSGVRYDPGVVKALCAAVEEIKAIMLVDPEKGLLH